jgi:hypothetical protein
MVNFAGQLSDFAVNRALTHNFVREVPLPLLIPTGI